MSGRDKQAEQTQRDASQAALMNSQTLAGIGNYAMGVSKDSYNRGLQYQQPLINYYQALTSGDMPATISAIAPQLRNITMGTKANESNIYNSVAPGAGRDYALAQNQMNKGDSIAQYLNNAYTGALSGLAGVGSQNLNQGLQYLGGGISGLGTSSNSATQGGQIAGQLSNQAAQRKAATMGFLGDLAGAGGMMGAAKMSDIRRKENISKVGEVGGVGWYKFNFIGDPQIHHGAMAQEVYEKYPEAVKVGGENPETEPWMINYEVLVDKIMENKNAH